MSGRERRLSKVETALAKRNSQLGSFAFRYARGAAKLSDARRANRVSDVDWATGMADLLVLGLDQVISPNKPLGQTAISLYSDKVLPKQDRAIIDEVEAMDARSMFGVIPRDLEDLVERNGSGEPGLSTALDYYLARIAVLRVAVYPGELIRSHFMDDIKPDGYLRDYIAMMSPEARQLMMGPGLDWRRAAHIGTVAGAYIDGNATKASPNFREAAREPLVGQLVAAREPVASLLALPNGPSA